MTPTAATPAVVELAVKRTLWLGSDPDALFSGGMDDSSVTPQC